MSSSVDHADFSWGPTPAGKMFTSTPDWQLSLDGARYYAHIDRRPISGSVLDIKEVRIKAGLIWARVFVPVSAGTQARLDGIPNSAALVLQGALNAAVETETERLAGIAADRLFDRVSPALVDWATNLKRACNDQIRRRGWLTTEFSSGLEQQRPESVAEAMRNLRFRQRVESGSLAIREAGVLWVQRPVDISASLNRRHLQSERLLGAEFFARVEKSPLTDEQIEAVITMDSRVLLVAAAGSGKTSTMVAKAAYALHKGYFEPERILLLAFNKAAAAELRERIEMRLEPLGLPGERVVAKTFHAFGQDVIGEVTGKRPSIAPWLESNQEMDALMRMIDALKDERPGFRLSWDMFRVVFGQDLPEFGKEEDGADSRDRTSNRAGFWTMNGEVVKSRGELLIANWMFYNGVEYIYEPRYEVDTADASHRQYTPDFFIPAANAYLEHWALDSHGRPPASFIGYAAGMAWKRALHKEHGTTLLETTMAQLWNGEAFRYLERELTARSVTLDPNPDRQGEGRKPMESPRLARMFRTFMVHAKGNRLSGRELSQRLKEHAPGPFAFRHRMFFDLYEQIAERWESELGNGGYVDFEDLLVRACDLIESGWSSPFELVMVDEFQDASQVRARMLQGLIRRPSVSLFCVGDDWQSINRFAGADLSVMTGFEDLFGEAVTLQLGQTFRCAPSLCDISSRFVRKNPAQLTKTVKSLQDDVEVPITIIQLQDVQRHARSVIERTISQLRASGPRCSILLLGRYTRERAYLPLSAGDGVDFMTVHGSKGLEADHVIVASMTSDILGFPSRVADDPVLQLALPAPEPYANAEERRLFYVAMTRARRTVTLLTQAGRESDFILELIRDFKVPVANFHGGFTDVEVCPTCGKGTLVGRRGPYGPFLGCSTYPACSFKRKH